MKRIVNVFLVAVFLFAPAAFAQDEVELQKELAETKIALLNQRRATIQAKSLWLDREQILLRQEASFLAMSVTELEEELSEVFECSVGYDLDKNACKPDLASESENN